MKRITKHMNRNCDQQFGAHGMAASIVRLIFRLALFEISFTLEAPWRERESLQLPN